MSRIPKNVAPVVLDFAGFRNWRDEYDESDIQWAANYAIEESGLGMDWVKRMKKEFDKESTTNSWRDWRNFNMRSYFAREAYDGSLSSKEAIERLHKDIEEFYEEKPWEE